MKQFESREEKTWLLLSIIAGLGCLVLWLYSTLIVDLKESAFGDKWVFTEITFISIPKSLFNTDFNIVLEFKLITLFVVFGISYWIFGLESFRKISNKFPILFKKLFFLISLIGVMTSIYEVLWNFNLWNAKIVSLAIQNPNFINTDMDGLAYLNPIFPVNLNFATKMYLLALFVSLYGVYYFYSLMKAENHLKKMS